MGVVHAELLAKLKERGLLRNAYVRVRNSGLLTQTDAQQALPMVQQNVLADMLAHEGLRLDGRSALDARPVTVEAGPLPVCGCGIHNSTHAQRTVGKIGWETKQTRVVALCG